MGNSTVAVNDLADISTRRRVPATPPLLIILTLAGLLMLLNGAVFIGAGTDDWEYLHAATCYARHGFCVASTHWASRSPLVVPLAGAIAVFGTNKAALALVPAVYSVGALTAFTALVQRQFGRTEAIIAGLVLLATPAFSNGLLRIHVDIPELAWLLASLFALQSRARGGGMHWMLLAGGSAGLAILTRSTSLVALPALAAVLLIGRHSRRDIVAFGCGLLMPLGLQFLLDSVATADPLHHWRLQLAHTSVPSTELPSAAAKSGSPLFNLTIIRSWPPSAGIDVHWSIRALVNLLASKGAGLTLCSAALLVAAAPRELDPRTRRGQTLVIALSCAAFWFAAVVYVLAIDPRPRMFEPVVAVASAVIGVLACRRLAAGERLFPVTLVFLIVAGGLLNAATSMHVDAAVTAAAHELEIHPDWVVDETSARMLAIEPVSRGVRVYPARTGPRLLSIEATACSSVEGLHGEWKLISGTAFPSTRLLIPGWLKNVPVRVAEPPRVCEYVPRRSARVEGPGAPPPP